MGQAGGDLGKKEDMGSVGVTEEDAEDERVRWRQMIGAQKETAQREKKKTLASHVSKFTNWSSHYDQPRQAAMPNISQTLSDEVNSFSQFILS